MKKFLSFSEMRLWNHDKAEYVRRYIDGEPGEKTPEMILGTIIHGALENPQYPWIHEMRKEKFPTKKIFTVRKLLNKMQTHLPPEAEITMMATTKSGIKLIAILDGFDKKNRVLTEYKTSEHEEAWNQFIVDRHQQLSFYAHVFHLTYHSFFRDINLHYLNTAKGSIKHFETARGIKDIEFIEEKIETCVRELKQAGLWEKRLSTKERLELATNPLFV